MKSIKNIFITAMCCLVAAVSFTACIDSEDNSIDDATYKQYMTQMSGQYNGKLRLFYAKSTNSGITAEKYDSLNTYWSVRTDSTITINNFPVSKLDSAIVVSATDKTENADMLRELRSQMRELPSTNLKAFYYIPSKSAITQSYVQFYVNPYVAESSFTYKGESKKVFFVFYSNAYSGIWTPSKQAFEFQMGLYAICLEKLDLNSTKAITAPYLRGLYMTCEAK